MKHKSRPLAGLTAGIIGIAALSAAAAPDGAALPEFHVDSKPLNRSTAAVASYAPVIKHVSRSVVNISSSRTVRVRRMPLIPDDPFFRNFFGQDNSPNQPRQRRQTRREESLGSGVIVSQDGYILTANHVVDGADPNGIKVELTSNGKQYTGKIVGADRATDVAVVKIDATDLEPITLGNSDGLEVGDVVLAIGNPFAVGQTVTMGIVSALGRTSLGINQYEDFIQTDAAINMGNSGGGLVDAEGRLVGINTAIFSPSGANSGIGFAVPVNLARSVMERLIKYGKVIRASIGVQLEPELTPDLAQEFNLPDQSGAMVTDVLPNSPAAKAGLQTGDVIRSVDDKKVSDMEQLRLMISQMAPGTGVTLKLLRSEPGKKPVEKTATVMLETLREPPTGRIGRPPPAQQNPTDQDSLDGVEVTDLDTGVRRQLGVPNEVHGALVTSVDEGSNSADAGLHEGDVILEIDRQAVRTAKDAVQLSKNSKGKHILVRVWREGGSTFILVDNTRAK